MKIKLQIKTLLNNQSGLTLIELLLVVVILSTVAFMTISVVENGTDQVRFEDTRNRLGLIRTAIVGETSPVFNGQRLLSGFASDNGIIPNDTTSIDILLNPDADFDLYDQLDPVFDPIPDATGYNNGTETLLTAENEILLKGWRGPYLQVPPSTVAGIQYLDGWGRQGPAPDFGWNVTETVTDVDISIESYGRDGADGSITPPFDDDLTIDIDSNDWRVDMKDFSVDITNSTGADIVTSGGVCLRATLLIYRNQTVAGTDGRWRRLTSECVEGPTPSSTNSCLDGDGDGLVSGVACLETKPVLFTEGDYDDGAGVSIVQDMNVPQGRHLLLLVLDDENLQKHDGAPVPCTSTSGVCPSTDRTTKAVEIFAGVGRPKVTMEITN